MSSQRLVRAIVVHPSMADGVCCCASAASSVASPRGSVSHTLLMSSSRHEKFKKRGVDAFVVEPSLAANQSVTPCRAAVGCGSQTPFVSSSRLGRLKKNGVAAFVVEPNFVANQSVVPCRATVGRQPQDRRINCFREPKQQGSSASTAADTTFRRMCNPTHFGAIPATNQRKDTLDSSSDNQPADIHWPEIARRRRMLQAAQAVLDREQQDASSHHRNHSSSSQQSRHSTLNTVHELKEEYYNDDGNSNGHDDYRHEGHLDLAALPTLASQRARGCWSGPDWRSAGSALSRAAASAGGAMARSAMNTGRVIMDMFNEPPVTLAALQRELDHEILARANIIQR